MKKGLILNHLDIENGLTIKKVRIPLANQGLVFLRGINHDTVKPRSNGAGKTTFADILQHCFYESTSRGLAKDEIIRGGSFEGFHAELEAQTSKGIFIIKQSRKHSKHGTSMHLFQHHSSGPEEISPPNSIVKTLKMVQRDVLNGMSEQQFHGAVYLSQAAGHPLVTGKGTEVSKYLSSTFGFDVYDDIRIKIKSAIDETAKRAEQADTYISALAEIDAKLGEYKDTDYILAMAKAIIVCYNYGNDQLTYLYETKAELAEQKAALARRQQLLVKLQGSAPQSDILTNLVKRKKLLVSVTAQLLETSSQKAVKESHEELLSLRSSQKLELDSLQRANPNLIFPTLAAAIEWVETVQDRYQKIASITYQGDSLHAEAKEFLKEKHLFDPALHAEHLKATVDYDSQYSALLVASSYVASLTSTKGSVCPCCGQKITDQHRTAELRKAELATKQLEQLRLCKRSAQNYLASKAEADVCLKEFLSFHNDIKEVTQTTKLPKTLEEAVISYESFLKSNDKIALKAALDKAYDVRDLMKSLQQEIPGSDLPEDFDFDSKIETLTKKQTTVEQDIESLQDYLRIYEELAALPDSESVEDQEQILVTEIKQLKDSLKETQILLNQFSNNAIIIKDLVSRRIKAASHLSQFQDDLKHLAYLKQLYKAIAKLKTRKLHTVVQAIRDILPQYTDIMFDGEDITFEINDDDPESVLLSATRPVPAGEPGKPGDRIWVPILGLSKGERAGLRVSLLWTLKDITSQDKSVDLLILDEADDGLDEEAGLPAFCSLLEKIRSQYGTVIVISQRKELTGVNFDKIWTAVKKDGITSFEFE